MIRRISSLCLFVFASALSVAAQCPKVQVSSPVEVDAGQSITFSASVTGGDRDVLPTYNWTVSDGTISAGQGTSTIVVETASAAGQSSTATVDVGGYERKCVRSASGTTGIKPKPQPARLIDRYGTVSVADRNARLDNFAIGLQNDPLAEGYVIVYRDLKSLPGEVARSLTASKNYLVNTRGIPGSRIATRDGGLREAARTELWIVPDGGTPPLALPTVGPPKKPEPKHPTTKKPA